jgi:hypothetical protein
VSDGQPLLAEGDGQWMVLGRGDWVIEPLELLLSVPPDF